MKKHWWQNQWLILTILIALIAGCIVYLVFNWTSIWEALKGIYKIDWPSFNEFLILLGILIPLVIPILLLLIRPIRTWVWKTIGEGPPLNRKWYSFIIPAFLFLPFTAILLVTKDDSLPSLTQFSLIALAPTLGGLVLTAGNKKSLKKGSYTRLLAVAQKFIVSTVCFIIFTSLIFISNLFKIDINSIEWSSTGFIRWIFFWGAFWPFLVGTFLFLLGISDLIFVLKHLRK